MKQKPFENPLRRLHGLTPDDQAGALMRSVQGLTAQNAAFGAITKSQGKQAAAFVAPKRRRNEGARELEHNGNVAPNATGLFMAKQTVWSARFYSSIFFYQVLRDMFGSPAPSSVRQVGKIRVLLRIQSGDGSRPAVCIRRCLTLVPSAANGG